jgi:hypothetical protein
MVAVAAAVTTSSCAAMLTGWAGLPASFRTQESLCRLLRRLGTHGGTNLTMLQ